MSTEAKKFEDSFKKYYSDYPSINQAVGARSYDALMAIGSVLSKCKKPDSECFKNNLYDLKDFRGATGPIGFDKNGDLTEAAYEMYKVENGKFVDVK